MADATDRRRVLISGARGFIGRHAVEEFQRRGFDVVPVSRPDRPQLHGIDIVVHLAGYAHVPRPGPRDLVAFRSVNVEASRALALDAARMGVERFVLMSSVAVMVPGDASREIDAYARSKADAERVVREALSGSKTGAVIVRAPMVYGPDAPGNFTRLAKLIARGWPLPFGGLENRRSMVSVWNLCDFLVMVSTHPEAAKSESPWLVSDDHDVSTTDLIETMAAALGEPARLFHVPLRWLEFLGKITGREREVRRLTGSLALDLTATRAHLGWQPPMSFAHGVAKSLSQGRQ